MLKDKIKKLPALKKIVAQAKKKRQKIVFTNGCFDILHLGHIRYLEQASLLGEKLIVAINSNSSVRKIKGRARPIMSAYERACLIAACECVDYVTIFTQTSPLNLIEALKPDLLVKGADWQSQGIVGKDIVQSYGGKVVCINFLEGYSSSSIIARIRRLNEEEFIKINRR